jgi:hypothetical protein
MTALTRFLYPVPASRSIGGIIAWWERRRPAFNLVVGASGLVTYTAAIAIAHLPPFAFAGGPPLGVVLAYGVLANLCYTLGWVIEGSMHAAWKDVVKPAGPVLFRQGLIFSVGVTLMPLVVVGLGWIVRVVRFFW